MSHEKIHRIYTVLSKNLTFLGLSMDEWVVLMVGVMGGLYMIMHGQLLLGSVFMIFGVFGTSSIKKFKKLSVGFSLKSALYMSGYWPSPSNNYPKFDIERYAK